MRAKVFISYQWDMQAKVSLASINFAWNFEQSAFGEFSLIVCANYVDPTDPIVDAICIRDFGREISELK